MSDPLHIRATTNEFKTFFSPAGGLNRKPWPGAESRDGYIFVSYLYWRAPATPVPRANHRSIRAYEWQKNAAMCEVITAGQATGV